ncbi:hypothetical protein BC936DRAFT_145096 [Jimgerdemannia flammicorona]|uniref:Uncharacterized protein n=1 Tax=Jimgerdemannia flammicorona TaxID=994334 RepID=A0A433DLW4_9FUNG|nr:hypothetical protein BC936DRAFT_145096 [Jimgerdemannia flammicorona]
MAAGDMQLFLERVAGQRDHLHAVQQRRRDRVQRVRRCDEYHVRQVEGKIQVVIRERIVLLRVQHLQEGCRRVAVVRGRGGFVDLVFDEWRKLKRCVKIRQYVEKTTYNLYGELRIKKSRNTDKGENSHQARTPDCSLHTSSTHVSPAQATRPHRSAYARGYRPRRARRPAKCGGTGARGPWRWTYLERSCQRPAARERVRVCKWE